MSTMQAAPKQMAPEARSSVDDAGGPVELAETHTAIVEEAAPTFIPPTASIRASAANEGVTAWHNSQTVTAMWANAAANNGFAAISGVGWRRINPAQETAHQTMVALLSVAHATGGKVNVRIEADNLIHEVYSY